MQKPEYSPATHNGTLTIMSVRTGNHRTFRIRTAAFDDGDKTVVEILTGPDNERDYMGLAFLHRISPWAYRVNVWKKYRGTDWQRLANVVQRLHELESKGLVTVDWATRCRACNRQLTTPESIATGIGPECRKKEQ